MYNPLISIITPNYNNSKYISETINSVLAQTYVNWEMIIIDDCSTDDSYEIAKKYSNNDIRIKVYRMDHNEGSALCRNKAIELSQGEYLAFLDSDDLWFPEKLQKHLKFMQINDSDFSFTEYEHIDNEGNRINKKAKAIKHLTYRKLLYHNFIGCLTVIIKQNLDNKIYGPDIKINTDYGLFLQYLKTCKNALGYNECLSKYRIRNKSLSKNTKQKIFSFYFLFIKIENINLIKSIFYMITNRIIKTIWKYK